MARYYHFVGEHWFFFVLTRANHSSLSLSLSLSLSRSFSFSLFLFLSLPFSFSIRSFRIPRIFPAFLCWAHGKATSSSRRIIHPDFLYCLGSANFALSLLSSTDVNLLTYQKKRENYIWVIIIDIHMSPICHLILNVTECCYFSRSITFSIFFELINERNVNSEWKFLTKFKNYLFHLFIRCYWIWLYFIDIMVFIKNPLQNYVK